jgi:thioesterase domain-containing protein
LAQHLGPDQPFYGLQDGAQNPVQITALAAHYVDQIRALQPQGPFLLGGICSGGVVAYEIAQQLRAEGLQVALLTLVEPTVLLAPGLRPYVELITSLAGRVTWRLGRHARTATRLDAVQQRAYVRLKAKVIANRWAASRYAPRPYPGRVDLFLTRESLQAPRRGRRDWRAVAADRIEVHEIPGTHATITGTDTGVDAAHMRVLAEQLRVCIDRALRDDGAI